MVKIKFLIIKFEVVVESEKHCGLTQRRLCQKVTRQKTKLRGYKIITYNYNESCVRTHKSQQT